MSTRSPRRSARCERRPAAASATPRILLPFLLITLIWGSTWIVIKDQLGRGAAGLVGQLPLLHRRRGDDGDRPADGRGPRPRPRRPCARGRCSAPSSSCVNYNFVYASEHYITSGLAAVVFALLVVPNAAAGLALLRRSGSAAASPRARRSPWPASPCCSSRRCGRPRRSTGEVLAGLGLVLVAVLAASISNVMQIMPAMKARPLAPMLGWAMLYGASIDAAFAWASSARR